MLQSKSSIVGEVKKQYELQSRTTVFQSENPEVYHVWKVVVDDVTKDIKVVDGRKLNGVVFVDKGLTIPMEVSEEGLADTIELYTNGTKSKEKHADGGVGYHVTPSKEMLNGKPKSYTFVARKPGYKFHATSLEGAIG